MLQELGQLAGHITRRKCGAPTLGCQAPPWRNLRKLEVPQSETQPGANYLDKGNHRVQAQTIMLGQDRDLPTSEVHHRYLPTLTPPECLLILEVVKV